MAIIFLASGSGQVPAFQDATFVTSTSDIGSNALTLPSGIQSGDIIIFLEGAVDDVLPAADVPSGFTQAIHTFADLGSIDVRSIISYKIADGTEGSTSIIGVDEFACRAAFVFRPNFTVGSATHRDTAGQATSGNPTAQVCNATGDPSSCVIVVGFGWGVAGVDLSFSPSQDVTEEDTFGEIGFDAKCKVYANTETHADHTIDIGDLGSVNVLQSLYLELEP